MNVGSVEQNGDIRPPPVPRLKLSWIMLGGGLMFWGTRAAKACLLSVFVGFPAYCTMKGFESESERIGKTHADASGLLACQAIRGRIQDIDDRPRSPSGRCEPWSRSNATAWLQIGRSSH